MKRESGILLHISSLPTKYGIGTLGREAYEMIDFLKAAGQSYWQILPIGPTSYGDSPYQSCSVYAGNPYFVDLDTLIEEGLLTEEDLDDCWWGEPGRVPVSLPGLPWISSFPSPLPRASRWLPAFRFPGWPVTILPEGKT